MKGMGKEEDKGRLGRGEGREGEQKKGKEGNRIEEE